MTELQKLLETENHICTSFILRYYSHLRSSYIHFFLPNVSLNLYVVVIRVVAFIHLLTGCACRRVWCGKIFSYSTVYTGNFISFNFFYVGFYYLSFIKTVFTGFIGHFLLVYTVTLVNIVRSSWKMAWLTFHIEIVLSFSLCLG